MAAKDGPLCRRNLQAARFTHIVSTVMYGDLGFGAALPMN